MMSEKTDILTRTAEELRADMDKIGEKAFRAAQIYEWLHVHHVQTFQEMTSLSKPLREKLDQNYSIPSLQTLEVRTSSIDGTKKYLFALEDGNVIESVMMRYSYGISVCISSQHVVIMGSGEPLDNYDNLVRFLRIIGDPAGERLSLRDITVSTCGIVPKIYELADEGLPVTLALSLHAPNQEKRQRLLPIAGKYPLDEVLEAMRYYFDKTGRRITFEYSCVEGENTSREDAAMLADLVRGMNCHINLIPVNPVEERSFRRPDRRDIEAFRKALEKRGISVTIRREMGRDINGACGQLRRSYLER